MSVATLAAPPAGLSCCASQPSNTTDAFPSSSGDADDPLYDRLREEALTAERSEPAISCLLRRTVLDPAVTTFEQAVAAAISHRLGSLCGTAPDICPDAVRTILLDALMSDERVLGHTMSEAVRADTLACVERDPACLTILEPLLFFKGFAALVLHRAARRRWGKETDVPNQTSRFVSFWLQSQASAAFGVDIHPAASIGSGIMLDHATGIVIGETAVVGDGCSLLHGVTLGGTGKDKHKDRHPKVGRDVLLGAGTSVLGNISIGDGAKVGAGSVVLQPIPHGATAVGAPAKVVGRAKESKPGSENDTCMRGVVPVHFRRHHHHHHHRGSHGHGRTVPRPLDRRRSKSVGSAVDGGVVDEHGEAAAILPLSAIDRAMSGPAAPNVNEINQQLHQDEYEEEEEEEEGEEYDELVKFDANDSADTIETSGSSSSGSDEEKKHQQRRGQGQGQHDPDVTNRGTCLDAEMYIWRNFGAVDAPDGTLNIYQLRRLLEGEGATEAEIGEVFFALVDDTPYIPEQDLRDKFPDIARKYTRIDCKCFDRILDCMIKMAKSPRKTKKKGGGGSRSTSKGSDDGTMTTASASAAKRERSNSVPEDFYSSGIGKGGGLPTIESEASFAGGEMKT